MNICLACAEFAQIRRQGVENLFAFHFPKRTLQFSNFQMRLATEKNKKTEQFLAGTKPKFKYLHRNSATWLWKRESGKVAKGKRKFSPQQHRNAHTRVWASACFGFPFQKDSARHNNCCLPTANHSRKDSVCFSQNMHSNRL